MMANSMNERNEGQEGEHVLNVKAKNERLIMQMQEKVNRTIGGRSERG